MVFEGLRAKSCRTGNPQAPPPTILEHTVKVVEAAARLIKETGRTQLLALGLEPAYWLERFERELRLAAFLHDLGKANDHFQGMVWGTRPFPQAIRHEAVSYWIASRPALRDWIKPIVGSSSTTALVLWAVAGHHRKFPPSEVDTRDAVVLLLSHRDFEKTLAWGAEHLGLGSPPAMTDATLLFTPQRKSVLLDFKDAHVEAETLMQQLPADEKRFLALLKACLICADVAGSIGRMGKQTIPQWISAAFQNVPTVAQLDEIVTRRLNGKTLHPFQVAVGARRERVVFVRAGCGSGKTLAAYRWSARQAERLGHDVRVFFCYPTMGTATEGYRDYLKDVDLDAALVHGRAEVDMVMLGLGDDEADPKPANKGTMPPEDEPGRAANDSAGALDQWSTPLVSCTVDTVLGLTQNNRRGIYAWPSIAGSALVFDEIHSYDEALFAALLRFLAEVRGVPCLLMTASLPADRLERIKGTLSGIGETLGEVSGPGHLECLKRYRRIESTSPWDRVEQALKQNEKVLWVVNTVDSAIALADDERAKRARAILYHSRFRYLDRIQRHREVIAAFKNAGPALAITTQVAEMSLDLSANLLVTQLCPISSLIQRLGRLNRRAARDDPWPFIVYEPFPKPPGYPLPYEQAGIDEAKAWLEALGVDALSQGDLIEKWTTQPSKVASVSSHFIWLDGGFVTEPRPLREASPGIEVILSSDRADVESRRKRPEEVRIPMPFPKHDPDWRSWLEVAFCKVPPADRIDYQEMRGARWTR